MTIETKSIKKFIKVDVPKELNLFTYAYSEIFINDDNEPFGYRTETQTEVGDYFYFDLWDKMSKEDKTNHIKHCLEKKLIKSEIVIRDIQETLKSLEENGIDDLVL